MLNTVWKYVKLPKSKTQKGTGRGRHPNPNTWKTGPSELRREKYYAWMKHRAQAKFRNEEHSLTFEDWETFWSDAVFLQRGRQKDNLILTRIDWELGWHVDNCKIAPRREGLIKVRNSHG